MWQNNLIFFLFQKLFQDQSKSAKINPFNSSSSVSKRFKTFINERGWG